MKAYWLSFALALTPLLMQLMAVVFLWAAVSRAAGRTTAPVKRSQQPA